MCSVRPMLSEWWTGANRTTIPGSFRVVPRENGRPFRRVKIYQILCGREGRLFSATQLRRLNYDAISQVAAHAGQDVPTGHSRRSGCFLCTPQDILGYVMRSSRILLPETATQSSAYSAPYRLRRWTGGSRFDPPSTYGGSPQPSTLSPLITVLLGLLLMLAEDL